MEHHELREPSTVDEHDAVGDLLNVGAGRSAEPAGGDEDAAIGLLAVQGPDECLDVRAAHRVVCGVPLCLDVDAIQAEHVLAHDTVDAAVAGATPVLGGARPAPIAHCTEQGEDELLEEDRRQVEYPLQYVGGESLVALPDGPLDRLERGRLGRFPPGRAGGRGVHSIPGSTAELLVLLEAVEQMHVDPLRLLSKHVQPALSDPHLTALRALHQPGLDEVRQCPLDATVEPAPAQGVGKVAVSRR